MLFVTYIFCRELSEVFSSLSSFKSKKLPCSVNNPGKPTYSEGKAQAFLKTCFINRSEETGSLCSVTLLLQKKKKPKEIKLLLQGGPETSFHTPTHTLGDQGEPTHMLIL